MVAIFKSSLQNLSPLPPRLNILLTKFKTKVLNLSLNLDLSPFVKLAYEADLSITGYFSRVGAMFTESVGIGCSFLVWIPC